MNAIDVSANLQAQCKIQTMNNKRMTIQTGCGCLLKYTLHNKLVRVLYTCTVAHCTDGHRLTNSGLSPSVILKTE